MKDKHCCFALTHFLREIRWMSDINDEGIKKYVTPYMQVGRTKLRLSYCPSCGANIRDIELTEI